MIKKLILILVLFLIGLPIVFGATYTAIQIEKGLRTYVEDAALLDLTGNFSWTNTGITNTTGKYGSSLDFGGTDVATASHLVIPNGAIDITIQFWLKTSTTGKFVFMRSDNSGASSQNGFYYYSPTSNPEARVDVGSFQTASYVATNTGQEWTMLTVIKNNTGLFVYENTTLRASQAGATGALTLWASGNDMEIGGSGAGAGSYVGQIDEFSVRDVTMPTEMINFIYNSGAGRFMADNWGLAPTADTFTITANDEYDSTSLLNLTVTIKNSTVTLVNSTQTGSLEYGNVINGLYDITISSNQSGGYYNKTYNNYNVTSNLVATLYQSVLYLNATDVTSETTILDYEVKAGSRTYTSNKVTGITELYLKAGTYNIVANTTGYINSTKTISTIPSDNLTDTLLFGDKHIHINATDLYTGDKINTFRIDISDLNSDYTANQSTTNGAVTFILTSSNFSVTISSNEYVTNTTIIEADTLHRNYTFQLPRKNSMLIRTFIEGTGVLINFETVMLNIDSSNLSATYQTENGTFYLENFDPNNYVLTLDALTFDPRNYIVTLNSGSAVVLNAFLQSANATEDITFIMKDGSNSKLLEGVLITISDRINLTYVVVEQILSDIAGIAIVALDQTNIYRFTLSKDGFQTRTFDLKPTLTSYTIEIQPETTIDYTTIYNQVDILTLPVESQLLDSVYDFDQKINFSIITVSLGGTAISYFGLNTSIAGTPYKTNVSGSPGGGTATISLNLSNVNLNSLGVTYFIKIDGEPIEYINREFFISNLVAGNTSLQESLPSLRDNLSSPALEIIGILIVLLVVGSFHALGVTGKNLTLVAGGIFGIITVFGFFTIVIGGIVTTIMFAIYFLSGDKLG